VTGDIVTIKRLNGISMQILKDATLFFSRGTPNLATVIPSMDFIDEYLATTALDSAYATPIRRSLLLAKRTLNRYYDMTDWSETYRIAMGICLYSHLFDSSDNLCSPPPSSHRKIGGQTSVSLPPALSGHAKIGLHL
jgi:hypothetical protein